MAEILGAGRRSVVARELTKAFESVRRKSLGELAAEFGGERPPKGEVVILVGPPEETMPDAADVDALLLELLAKSPVSAAAAEAASRTGIPRRDLYRRALALRKDSNDGAT